MTFRFSIFSRVCASALILVGVLGIGFVSVPAREGSKEWVVLKDCRLIANLANDGDSFHVSSGVKEYLFRLYFVDAPETDEMTPRRLVDQAKYFAITVPQAIEVGQAAKAFTQQKLSQPFTVFTHMSDAMGQSRLERFYAWGASVGRTNVHAQRSRMTSCNSTLRQARSLFGKKIAKFVPLPEPPPFQHVEFFPRQSAKYFSRIDAKALLTKAQSELAERDSPAFLVVLIALAAGLRKGEIDTLCWHQIDFERGVIRVEDTETASLKSADSRGEVPIDASVVELLKGFRARATGAFVIEGGDGVAGPRAWGRDYRVQGVFDRATAWLRKHGVTAKKPLHELRKELGALITAEHGIYAASRVLRHADLSTTAAHYTDLKTRPTIPVGEWLMSENVVPMKRSHKRKATA